MLLEEILIFHRLCSGQSCCCLIWVIAAIQHHLHCPGYFWCVMLSAHLLLCCLSTHPLSAIRRYSGLVRVCVDC